MCPPHVSLFHVRACLRLFAFSIDLCLMRCVVFFLSFRISLLPPFAFRPPPAIGEDVSPSSPSRLHILPTPSCVRRCEMAYNGEGSSSRYTYTHTYIYIQTPTHTPTQARRRSCGWKKVQEKIVCLLALPSLRSVPPPPPSPAPLPC